MDRVSVTKLEVGQRLSHKDMETLKGNQEERRTQVGEMTQKKESKKGKEDKKRQQNQKLYEHMIWTQ
jgi:hypothetical protein